MTQSGETNAPDRPARLTLQGFADSVQRELFDLDRGLLGTWLLLWRRPGTTLRRYVDWRDPRLTPPVRYAIVCLALSALLLEWFDLSGYTIGFAQGLEESRESSEPAPAWTAMLAEYLHWWLYLVAVPAMAAALESGYRTRINWAEALAFATYSLAQVSLGLVLLTILWTKVLGDTEISPLLLLWPIHFAAACYGYFKPDGASLGRAFGTTVVMVAYLVLFTIVLVTMVVAVGSAFG